MVVVRCSTCGQRLNVPEHLRETNIRCRKCALRQRNAELTGTSPHPPSSAAPVWASTGVFLYGMLLALAVCAGVACFSMERGLAMLIWLIAIGWPAYQLCTGLLLGILRLGYYAHDESPSTILDWHSVVVVSAATCAAVGSGMMMYFDFERNYEGVRSLRLRILHAVLLGGYPGFLGGLFFGVSVACLVAPAAFFHDRANSKWVKLIGTNNLVTARCVCAGLAVLIAGLFALFCLMYLYERPLRT